MKKLTQLERVRNQLLKEGQISRNACLRNFISRLSAIIQVLEEERWVFDTKHDEGDYVYVTKTCPLTKVVYKVGEREITTYKK